MYIENLVYLELHEQTNKLEKSVVPFCLSYCQHCLTVYTICMYACNRYPSYICILGMILRIPMPSHLQEQQR